MRVCGFNLYASGRLGFFSPVDHCPTEFRESKDSMTFWGLLLLSLVSLASLRNAHSHTFRRAPDIPPPLLRTPYHVFLST